MTGFYSQVVQVTTEMATRFKPVFGDWGLDMFYLIAPCLVVYEGLMVAFGSRAESRLPALLMQISITWAVLICYSTPFPVGGKDFTHVITDAGSAFADEIDTTAQESAGADMANAMGDMSMSTWWAFLNTDAAARYLIIFFCMSAMQIAMLGIIAFGFIAVGTLVVIGPVLIPFNLVPGFDWMAWGWMRSLIQYSFYPVIGNAFIYVIGSVWANLLGQWHTTGPVDLTAIGANLTAIVIVTFAGLFGILKVPQLVAGLFSGSSGISAMPGIGWWR